MAKVAIILGSASDRIKYEKVLTSMAETFSKAGVEWELSIISAHRNPVELRTYCERLQETAGVEAIIAAAGMAAALPGAVAANLPTVPVIGVALPSTDFPDGMDALLAITRMPPGVPVACTGIGESGLKNAAILACQILHPPGGVRKILGSKSPEINISIDGSKR